MPTLPIVRSQTTGSRRKKSGQRVSSGDVDIVSPGVGRVRDLNAPKGAFQTTAGIAAQEIGPAALAAGERLKVAEIKVQNRADIVERSKGSTAYRALVNKQFTEADDTGDLSDEGALGALGDQFSTALQESLDAFQGSDDAKARYEVDLRSIQDVVITKASEKAKAIGDSAIDVEIGARTVGLVSSATGDPTIENIRLNWLASDAVVSDFSNSLDPLEESAKAKGSRERISIGAFNAVFGKGNHDQARALLNDPEFFASLSKQQREDSRNRLDKAIFDKKSIATDAARAGAIRTAQNTADAKNMDTLLAKFGLSPLSIGGTDPESVTAPFTDGAVVSSDMQDVNRLFAGAQALALGGMTAEAGALMQQARFLMANSPEIQESKEMDKPLSPKAAGVLGVPVGTTMRDVAGIIPPSPEETARSTAVARAEGKGEVEAKEQIGFIDEASTMITDLQEELVSDPNLVGVLGGLRASGQTVTGVLGDLGLSEIVDSVKDMAFTDTEASADDMFDWFDSPTLSNLQVLENSIGLIFARLRTKSGRVPVEVIRLSIKDVKLSGLTSAKQVQNRLNFLNEQLTRRKARLQKQFELDEPLNDADDRSDFKVVDGKLVSTDKAPATEKNFPKVSDKTQGKRDLKRKDIIKDELAEEKRLLAEATNDEDKELHNRNIKALEKELK